MESRNIEVCAYLHLAKEAIHPCSPSIKTDEQRVSVIQPIRAMQYRYTMKHYYSVRHYHPIQYLSDTIPQATTATPKKKGLQFDQGRERIEHPGRQRLEIVEGHVTFVFRGEGERA